MPAEIFLSCPCLQAEGTNTQEGTNDGAEQPVPHGDKDKQDNPLEDYPAGAFAPDTNQLVIDSNIAMLKHDPIMQMSRRHAKAQYTTHNGRQIEMVMFCWVAEVSGGGIHEHKDPTHGIVSFCQLLDEQLMTKAT